MFDKIQACGIVPVIKLTDAAKAVPLSKALLKGGVNLIEITFRTAAAPEAIARVAADCPDMIVGAGTVLTQAQLETAQKSGAKFVVSPGFDPSVVKAALGMKMPILPGVVTPTELCAGLALGLEVFKFFPAENYGGASTIKSLAAPFSGISFVPTGGISEKNACDYWKLKCVLAVGGSWMAPEALIEAGDFDEIARRTEEAVNLMKKSR